MAEARERRPPRDPGGHLTALTLFATLLGVLPVQLDEEAVRAGHAEALAAVTELLEPRLEPAPALRFVTASELGERVAAENLELFTRQLGDPDRARASAEQAGAQFAQFAYAKYAWSSKELLVVLPTWNAKARQFDRVELIEEEAVRAVLVHELVHALDDQLHDLGGSLLACVDGERMAGFNAALEGHAQLLARRVCAARGWDDGFETFTAMISALPPGLDEASLQLARVQVATAGAAYLEGERFVAALLQGGGEEALARAFRTPTDGQTVFHPEWFLDPSRRPVPRFDPEPAFAALEARYPAESWSRTRLGLTSGQLSASLALLEPASVGALVAGVLSARMTVLQPLANPAGKQIALAVFEFHDEAAAQDYMSAAAKLNRIKDERMTRGFVRILSAGYEDFSVPEDGGSGFLATKRIAAGKTELLVSSVDVRRGVLVLETIFSGEPIEKEAHLGLLREALGALETR